MSHSCVFLNIITEITQYTAIPGTSRHHWGTDIDIVDAYGYYTDNPLSHQNFEPAGFYQYLPKWLETHAAQFGFVLTYTNNPTRSGFAYEPWHYSYSPLAKNYYQKMLQINFLHLEEIKNCKGLENLNQDFWDNYLEKYFKSINSELK